MYKYSEKVYIRSIRLLQQIPKATLKIIPPTDIGIKFQLHFAGTSVFIVCFVSGSYPHTCFNKPTYVCEYKNILLRNFAKVKI